MHKKPTARPLHWQRALKNKDAGKIFPRRTARHDRINATQQWRCCFEHVEDDDCIRRMEVCHAFVSNDQSAPTMSKHDPSSTRVQDSDCWRKRNILSSDVA